MGISIENNVPKSEITIIKYWIFFLKPSESKLQIIAAITRRTTTAMKIAVLGSLNVIFLVNTAFDNLDFNFFF